VIDTPSVDWLALSPTLALLAVAGITLLGAVLVPRSSERAFSIAVSVAGFGASAVLAGWVFDRSPEPTAVVVESMTRDRLGALAAILIALVGLAVVLLSAGDGRRSHVGEYYALLAAAAAGMVFFVSAANLMTMFLALEWFSIALYVLCALDTHRRESLEAGLKYLIIGSFSSGILLFGCALVYGATGELGFDAIREATGADNPMFVTGMAMNPEVFKGFRKNLLDYYEHMRREDVYGVYAVIPPQAARNPEFYVKQNIPVPTLRVVREDDDGVVISGMKMLATGAVFANEIWIGNLIPLAPNQLAESITCAIPVNAPGVTLWARKPYERHAQSEFESPLAWRFDETDSMVMCDSVKVPWERVFVHMDAVLAREIYIKTPGHCYGNHQSNVRFHAKMQLIVGLASKIAQASGANEVPAVREVLGRFAALEAALGGMIAGQLHDAEDWPAGFKTFNRRYMYAALNWCTESHSAIIDALRELIGGGIFQMPADITVMHDAKLRKMFETYWQTPQLGAVERMKLYKLAWDLIGSEFAGRHLQYEKFYAGASFIVRNHSFREAPWEGFHKVVDDLMGSYDVPAP